MKEYKTVEKASSDFFIEKKSKFIGYVSPIKSVDDANVFIKEIKSKHWDATHNVYAYVLKDGFIQKYSDDGEPSGTAGMPVLDVILKENLVDVCVVVTRYFGGTLLGAGGLVRAYSHSSKIALDSGNIITMAPCKIFKTKVDYSFFDRLKLVVDELGANVENTEFLDSIEVTFSIKESSALSLENKLTELSNGKCVIKEIGEKYAKI